MRRVTSWIARVVPEGVYRRVYARDVVGFFYHTVSDLSLPHIAHLYPYKSPEQFESDLIYIKERFTPLGYAELEERLRGGLRLPPNALVLSFDDGFAECWTTIRPLLLKHNIPAIFFLTIQTIDNRDMLLRQKVSLCLEGLEVLPEAALESVFEAVKKTYDIPIDSRQQLETWLRGFKSSDHEPVEDACEWLGIDWRVYLRTRKPYLTLAQIQELHADGFTIGAHSLTHAKLATLSREEIEKEIVSSCRSICGITGENRVPFAFPFTATGIDRSTLDEIVTKHPEVGLLFNARGLRKDRSYIVNRIMADEPGEGQGTNLPGLLRRAYEEMLVERLGRLPAAK